MYGVISDDLPDGLLRDHLKEPPVGFQYSLEALSHDQVDGWGIAYYPDYGDPATLERGAIRAYNDPYYDTVVGNINVSKPKITVAHIRTCVSGCCEHGDDSVPNPHPFYREKNGKTWTFAHNGVVSKDRMVGLMGDYLNANPPNGSDILPECDPSNPSLVVDTELYFLYVLKKIEENGWHAVNGIVEAVTSMIADGEGGGMNFIMSDGDTLWAFKRGASLYYLYDATDPAHAFSAVATRYPSSSQGDWEWMDNYELAILTRDAPPVIMDVRDHPENYVADASFSDSTSAVDLRTDGPGQDWYESHGDDPTLLTLDETDVAGNDTKKAKISGNGSNSVYVSQEFLDPQTSTFPLQWDIYVDEITATGPNRSVYMLMGDEGGDGGPNAQDADRFVCMAFYKEGGGSTGTMDLVARQPGDGWEGGQFTRLASCLNLDQWYTVKVDVDVPSNAYDIYLDGLLVGDDIQAYTSKTSLTHISFATLEDGSGPFYVDNVMESSQLYVCRGDINKDGAVNDLDLSIFADSFGQTGNGDFNFDCDVDGSDLAVFGEAFENDCP